MTDQQQSSGRVNAVDKRIFGGGSDVNQLVPFRYMWAWEAYLAANKNHWLPGHFHVQMERELPMDGTTRLVLELYLAWRLVLAKVVRESLPCLYRATTAPECRQYMLRHMQEESVAIDAIQESGLLDLDNMGLWVDAMVARIADQFPTEQTMLEHDYALAASAMVVYKAYAFTAMETWLMKEVQLPPETRRLIQALQRDTVAQRNFYTDLLATFLTENPRMRALVQAATIETANADTVSGFRLHWFNHDLTKVVEGPATQFAEHCWDTTLSKLRIGARITPSPYAQSSNRGASAPAATSPLSWD